MIHHKSIPPTGFLLFIQLLSPTILRLFTTIHPSNIIPSGIFTTIMFHVPQHNLISRSIVLLIFITIYPSDICPSVDIPHPINNIYQHHHTNITNHITTHVHYHLLLTQHNTAHHTIPHHVITHHTIPHHVTPHHTTLYHITPHHITPHHTTPHYTTPHHTTTP